MNEADATLGIKRCFFAPRILGAKLGAKPRPLQTVQNQQVPDFLGCRGAWSGVGVQQAAFKSLSSRHIEVRKAR